MERMVIQHTASTSTTSDPFNEVIEFVQQLYKEFAQNKLNFSDYNCIFCLSEYSTLAPLLTHIEYCHRDQVLDGTFNLHRNSGELIRNRIAINEQPSVVSNRPKMNQQHVEQLYQCAKCFATFEQVEDVTQHLAQCALEDTYSNNYNTPPPAQPSNQQPQSHSQQSVPLSSPIGEAIYGCGRCGSKFRLVRELVVHLHSCINESFQHRAQFLTPELWVQAPDGQHIVINETETNTTLNTAGLWLMSHNGVAYSDIVSKGFWVMPPANNHDLPLTALNTTQEIKTESILSNNPPQNSGIIMHSYNDYSDQQAIITNVPNPVQSQNTIRYAEIQNEAWTDNNIRKSTLEENKRKRGRTKVINSPIKNKTYNMNATSFVRETVVQPEQQQVVTPKYIYLNSEGEIIKIDEQHINNGTKRKRPDIASSSSVICELYENEPSTTHVAHTTGPNENYILSTFDESTFNTQHVTKDEIIYETLTPYTIKESPPQRVVIVSNPVEEVHNIQLQQSPLSKKKSQFPELVPIQSPKQSNTNPIVIANASSVNSCDFDDLSHLDKPINDLPTRLCPIKARQSDYIESYCSFLKTRTHK